MSNQTDEELLSRLLEEPERLSEREVEVFSSMSEFSGALSEKQRRWIRSVADRLGIQIASSENTFSELPPEVQREHRLQVRTRLPWELPGYVKSLKPPGRG